jgi:peptidylamidoglycolate lyase
MVNPRTRTVNPNLFTLDRLAWPFYSLSSLNPISIMHSNEYLFPKRLTRRDFLATTAVAVAGLAAPNISFAKEKKAPVRIGSGYHTYEAVEGWGALPAGMSYGMGCGIIVDGKDRVYVTTRSSSPCVAIFDRKGKLLETWGNEFAAKVGYENAEQVKETAHCLYWSKEGGEEFIYWTENISKNKEGPKIGARVYKTDLRGKILYEIGNVAKEGGASQKFDWTNPTDVAVAPNGDIYVVDGYGSQRVTRFDKNFKPLRTIGGKGKEDALFNTCHGVWVKLLKGREPEVYIADRNNNRFQVFDLELNHKRTLKGDVRNPCCFYQHKDQIYIPDLGGRVTILDANDKVLAHLGDGREADGKTAKPDNKTNPALFAAPHAMCVDSRGDLYVVEWVDFGRPRKFKHTPA